MPQDCIQPLVTQSAAAPDSWSQRFSTTCEPAITPPCNHLLGSVCLNQFYPLPSKTLNLVAGDVDINPESGRYRLSGDVAGVEVNELRKTLGIRPTPYSVGGAVRGVLHVTGPLDQPVFSGWSQRCACHAFGMYLAPFTTSPCVSLSVAAV